MNPSVERIKPMTNLLFPLPDATADERFEQILARPGVRIERIVSHGQITPPEQPWLQDHDEWVLLLAGEAEVTIDGRDVHRLAPGDHLFLPAGIPHRVTFTAPDRPTVWLAIHFA